MTTPDGFAPWYDEGSLSIGGLASRQSVTHVALVAELAQPDPFESDEEYEAILADLRIPARRTRLTLSSSSDQGRRAAQIGPLSRTGRIATTRGR